MKIRKEDICTFVLLFLTVVSVYLVVRPTYAQEQSKKDYVMRSIVLTPNHMTLEIVKGEKTETYSLDLLNAVISHDGTGKSFDAESADNANKVVNSLARFAINAVNWYNAPSDPLEPAKKEPEKSIASR